MELIIRDGDRKSWDPRAPMIWDNFSIFRTSYAILTSYISGDPPACRGSHVDAVTLPDQKGECGEILLQIFHSDGQEK